MGSAVSAFLLMGFLFSAILVWSWYRRKRVRDVWGAVSAEYDLGFVDGGWFGQFELHGVFEGADVRVFTETRGSGKNKKTYTVYEVKLPEKFPFDLVVYDEGFFSQIGKFFGGEDIEVGYPAIDDAFIIKGERPGRIRDFFAKEGVPEAFRELQRSADDVHIEHGSLQIDNLAMEANRTRLLHNLEVVTDFCQRIETALGAAESESPEAERDEPERVETGVNETHADSASDRDSESHRGTEGAEEDEAYVVEW